MKIKNMHFYFDSNRRLSETNGPLDYYITGGQTSAWAMSPPKVKSVRLISLFLLYPDVLTNIESFLKVSVYNLNNNDRSTYSLGEERNIEFLAHNKKVYPDRWVHYQCDETIEIPFTNEDSFVVKIVDKDDIVPDCSRSILYLEALTPPL